MGCYLKLIGHDPEEKMGQSPILNLQGFKFDNYEEVRNDLRKSMGRVLIHPAMRCSEEKVKTRRKTESGVKLCRQSRNNLDCGKERLLLSMEK